jgi:hypothetical protein
MRNLKYHLIAILSLFCYSCFTYKAGNLEVLDIPIKSNISSKIIRQYIDTMLTEKENKIPTAWLRFDKLIDLDSVTNVRVYFKESPQEMYLLSFNGMLVLSDVYNPRIKDWDWVTDKELLTKDDSERIKARMQSLLKHAFEFAVSKKTPDSLIYIPYLYRFRYNDDTTGYSYYRKINPNAK